MKNHSSVRTLALVLGDQLTPDSPVFDAFDKDRDLVWMAETHTEATHVWCHKIRLVFFFSAMRHFRRELESEKIPVRYHELTEHPENDSGRDFAEILAGDLKELHPEKVRVVLPGDLRVEGMLKKTVEEAGLELEILPDPHFYVTPEEFRTHAEGRKQLVMEHFYREQRRRHQVLMEDAKRPEGGDWNYDAENRKTFGKEGPGELPAAPEFRPDPLTREVMDLVESRFPDHPGNTGTFDWPVTRREANRALDDFIEHRLPAFGPFEDAMWQEQALLYHSRLSALLNCKLLHPEACVTAAEEAWHAGAAPLNSVEGFIRQILGWREFVRGVYYQEMPQYAERNALRCPERDVPTFFWDGETDMACVKDSMQSVLDHAWSHHIPRLMVLGQFSLLLGVHPCKFHEWHMAMYADAVDWVSLPNTLGMSQFGDGGIVGTKPYCASGNYINRMSNHCKNCRYDPQKSRGEDACPFTTLYWDFLDRHRQAFSKNRRMNFQMRNLERKSGEDLKAIRRQARILTEKAEKGERI